MTYSQGASQRPHTSVTLSPSPATAGSRRTAHAPFVLGTTVKSLHETNTLSTSIRKDTCAGNSDRRAPRGDRTGSPWRGAHAHRRASAAHDRVSPCHRHTLCDATSLTGVRAGGPVVSALDHDVQRCHWDLACPLHCATAMPTVTRAVHVAPYLRQRRPRRPRRVNDSYLRLAQGGPSEMAAAGVAGYGSLGSAQVPTRRLHAWRRIGQDSSRRLRRRRLLLLLLSQPTLPLTILPLCSCFVR